MNFNSRNQLSSLFSRHDMATSFSLPLLSQSQLQLQPWMAHHKVVRLFFSPPFPCNNIFSSWLMNATKWRKTIGKFLLYTRKIIFISTFHTICVFFLSLYCWQFRICIFILSCCAHFPRSGSNTSAFTVNQTSRLIKLRNEDATQWSLKDAAQLNKYANDVALPRWEELNFFPQYFYSGFRYSHLKSSFSSSASPVIYHL